MDEAYALRVEIASLLSASYRLTLDERREEIEALTEQIKTAVESYLESVEHRKV